MGGDDVALLGMWIFVVTLRQEACSQSIISATRVLSHISISNLNRLSLLLSLLHLSEIAVWQCTKDHHICSR